MSKFELQGTRLLRVWMQNESLTRRNAASRLGVGLATLDSWVQGLRRPGLFAARVIEEASSGLVKADDWLTGDELAQVRSAGRTSQAPS
jgi:transposase